MAVGMLRGRCDIFILRRLMMNARRYIQRYCSGSLQTFIVLLAMSGLFCSQIHGGVFPQNVGKALRIDLTLQVAAGGGEATLTPYVVAPDGDVQLQSPATITLPAGNTMQFSFVFYNPEAGVYTIGSIVSDNGVTPTTVSVYNNLDYTRLTDGVNEFVLRPTDPSLYSVTTTGAGELVELNVTTIYGAFLDSL
jgi:hypothetical protein